MGFFSDHTFFFVAFGSAALIVTIYHCVLSVFCHPQQHFNEQPQPATGLGQVDIHSIPIHKHTKTTGKSPNEECPVCLSEFEDGEELRTLPKCLHTFHVDCIDLWLHSHPNCPTCRTDAMPAVQETSTNNNSSSNAGATVNLVSINSISQDLEAQHRVV